MVNILKILFFATYFKLNLIIFSYNYTPRNIRYLYYSKSSIFLNLLYLYPLNTLSEFHTQMLHMGPQKNPEAPSYNALNIENLGERDTSSFQTTVYIPDLQSPLNSMAWNWAIPNSWTQSFDLSSVWPVVTPCIKVHTSHSASIPHFMENISFNIQNILLSISNLCTTSGAGMLLHQVLAVQMYLHY